MDERTAIIGILLISAIAATSFFALSPGTAGLATSQSYVACCCNILQSGPDGQALVTSQIQTFADNCNQACAYYNDQGHVFAQQGFCAMN